MARNWTEATGELPAGALGQPTAERSIAVTGPTEPNDRRADTNDRTRSGEISRSAATDDPSRSRCPDSTGLRAGHRKRGALSLRQADRQLSRSGSSGRIQWRTTTAGTYQQAGECLTALLPGGSGTGDGTARSRMA